MLFLSLNVVIGTIVVTSRVWKNNTTNRDFSINLCLLYILSTFNLSRDKVEKVAKCNTQEEEEKIIDNVVLVEKERVKMGKEMNSKWRPYYTL